MRCRDVSDFLAGDDSVVAGSADIDGHIATCESCSAQKEQFSELTAAMASLAEESVEPPGWLLASVSETVLEKTAQREAVRKLERQIADPKFITTGALVAAGIAGALLMRGRRRRRHVKVRTRLREALTPA